MHLRDITTTIGLVADTTASPIWIVGETCVGKTTLAHELLNQIGLPIIDSDGRPDDELRQLIDRIGGPYIAVGYDMQHADSHLPDEYFPVLRVRVERCHKLWHHLGARVWQGGANTWLPTAIAERIVQRMENAPIVNITWYNPF